MCLKAFCDEAMEKFKPKLAPNGKDVLETYCNFGADYVGHALGYNGFRDDKDRPLTADQICSVLMKDWIAIDGEQAFRLAQQNTWCMAAMSSAEIREAAKRLNKSKLLNAKHGHISTVYPSDKMGESGSWNKKVPIMANVGTKNKPRPASECFPAEPKYYFLPGGRYSKGELK